MTTNDTKLDLKLFCDIIFLNLSDNITNKTNNVKKETINV